MKTKLTSLLRRVSAAFPALLVAFGLAAPAQGFAMSYADFINALVAGNGTYNGNGVTVSWSSVSDANDTVNNKVYQYYVGGRGTGDLTVTLPALDVSNVNFVFTDENMSDSYVSAELQVFSDTMKFTNCNFTKVSVSPWGSAANNNPGCASATFDTCSFTGLTERYAIHQSRAASLTVKNCTINGTRGIHINRANTLTDVTITGNTFTGIDATKGCICLANDASGDYSETAFNVSGNNAADQTFLRQLNPTLSYAQAASILDTTKNTYGTAYVSGSIEPDPITGSGTQADPYIIANIDALKAFRDRVNAGNTYAGKVFKLTADIDLNNEEWEPIGLFSYRTKSDGTGETVSPKKPFCGTFDGDNHTISNLKMSVTKGGKAYQGAGLFGYTTDTAVIKNLNLHNADVQGRLYVGTIVGYGYTGNMIDNCHVSGVIKVEGSWYVGGLGGSGYMSKITNCSVIGDVGSGSYVRGLGNDTEGVYGDGSSGYIGGLWGFRGEGANVIAHCTVQNISVEGQWNGTGGIVGIAHYGNVISNCTVSAMSVSASEDENNCGLIAGSDLTPGNPSTPAKVLDCTVGEGATASAGTGAAQRPVTTQLGAANNNGTLTTSENSALVGFDVVYDESGKVTGGTFEKIPDSVVAHGYAVSEPNEQGLYTVAVDPYADYTKVADGFYQSGTTYGNSTDFYITNLNGLKYFRDLVNGVWDANTNYCSFAGTTANAAGVVSWHTNNLFKDKTVHLLCDVDLENEEWTSIGYYQNSLSVTYPVVGTENETTTVSLGKVYFYGLFDAGIYEGGNLVGTHKISNLKTSYQYAPGYSGLTQKYQSTGLFGLLGGAPSEGVKNLTLENVTVTGRQYAGAVAGRIYNAGAVIDNCHVIGTININGSSSYVGGLVGECRGVITNSSVYATGTVSGTYNVGGLAGGIFQNGSSAIPGIYDSAVSNITVSTTSYAYGLGALAGVASLENASRNVVISGCDANNVTVTTTKNDYTGLVGELVGYSQSNKDTCYTVMSDNTVSGTTSASQNGTPVSTLMGHDNLDYAIIGNNVTFDESGKVTGGIFENIPTAAIATGYITEDNPDTETSTSYPLIIGGPYVAVVYDANDALVGGYATFKAAIDAANASSSSAVTVKLLDDITEPLPTDLAATKTMTITTDVAGGVELNIHSSSYNAFTAENGCTVTFGSGVKITGVRQLGVWDDSAVMNLNNPVRTSQLVANGGTVNINSGARIRFYDDGAIHTWGGQYVINGNLAAGEGLTATVASVGAENLQLDGGYANYRYNPGASFTMNNAIIRTQFSNESANDDGTFPVTLNNSVLYATGSSFSMGTTSQGTLTLNGSRIVADGVNVTIDANDSVVMDWKSSVKAKNFANTGTLVVDMAGFDGTLPITIVETTDGAATLGDFSVINSSVGAKVKVDANGNLVVVEKYVAQIGSTKFETLADAIAEAEFRGEETTITLLKDITEESTETSDGNFAAAYIPIDVEVILDLNGHDIVNTTTGDSAKKQYGIYNEGTLTILDSADDGTTGSHVYTMNVARQGNDAILNQAGGVLTVRGGWFGDADSDKTNVNLFTRGASLRNSGDVTLEGGHFTNIDNFSIDGDTYAYAIINLDGDVVVNDGTDIYGEQNGIFGVVGGNVTVNGGSFSLGRADAVMYDGNQSYVYYLIYAAGGNATVNGGTWNKVAMPRNGWASGYDFAGNPMIAGGNWTLEFGTFDSAVVSGGIFNKAVPAARCATDYSPAANTDPATSATYPYTVVSDYEAQIVRNGAVVTPKGSLTAMITAAQAGDTVQVLKDVNVSSVVLVGKSITIDGTNHKITTSTASRVFRVTTSNIDVTFKNVEITSTGVADNDRRGISIDSPISNLKVTLENVKLTAPDYALNLTGGNDIAIVIKDSEIKGWAAINSFASDSTFAITNSTLHGYNDTTLSKWHNFVTISLDGNTGAGRNNTITIHDSQIVSESPTGNLEFWVWPHNGSVNNTIIVTGDSSIVNANNENDVMNFYFDDTDLTSSITVPASMLAGIADVDAQLRAKRTARTDNGNGTYTIKVFEPVAKIGDIFYESFAAAIAVADAAVAAGGEDPAILVLNSSASQTNPDWKISDGYLVRKVYVAQIGDDKYETLTEAIAAANVAEVDEITILDGTSVSPDADWKVADGKLVRKVYVAQIGSTKYESLADAIADVPADSTATTITMIADEAIEVAGYALTIPATKNVVLDLNGHTVVGQCTEGSTSALILNQGTLTIEDSSNDQTGKLIGGADPTWTWDGTDDYSGSYASNVIRNEGTLVVNGGTLYNASSGSAAYAIDNYSAGKVTINGGTVDAAKASAIRMFYNNGGKVTVNDGTVGHYTDNSNCSYMGIQVMSGTDADVEITGGTIAATYAVYSNGTGDSSVGISGGTFNGGVGFGSTGPADVAISGGTFNSWVEAWGTQTGFISDGTFAEPVEEEYCADGYIPTSRTTTDPETGDTVTVYGVKRGEYVAQVTVGSATTKYETIADALTAFVAENSTLTILKVDTYANLGTINIPAEATFNGGGATLSGSTYIVVNPAGATIKNVSFDYGESRYTTKPAIKADGLSGTLVVTECAFQAANGPRSGALYDIQVTPVAGATVTITDNVFNGRGETGYVLVKADSTAAYTATVTGNAFNAGGSNTKRAFAVVNAADADELTLSGNYIANGLFFGASADDANVSERAYPQLATADAQTATVALPTFIVKKNANDNYPHVYGYATLAAAVTGATSGDTILMTDDATIAASIETTKTLTVDGQNHTLAATDSWALKGVPQTLNGVTTYGSVTLQNVTLDCANGGVDSLDHGIIGSGVTIDARDADNTFSLKVNSVANGTVLKVTQGNLAYGQKLLGVVSSVGDVTVTADLNEATYVSLSDDGFLTVTMYAAKIGNTPYATLADAAAAADAALAETGVDPEITVIDTSLAAPAGWVISDGKLCRAVAKIGGTYYLSLADAVDAARSGDTIELLRDDRVSLANGAEITIDKSLTITGAVDANGNPLYTIYGTSNATGINDIFVTGSGNVTISNVNIEGFGYECGTDPAHAPIYVSSNFTGSFNLDTVNVSKFNRGGVFLYGGEFNVTNCYIDCANSRSGAYTKGIEIKGDAHGTIQDTVIVNMERATTSASTAGIEIYGSGSIVVDGCTIISDVDPHQSVKATYGIVSSRVGVHDPSGGSLLVTNCIIDVSNAALSVADSDEYGPVNSYSIVVDGEETYFGNYIATWSAGSEITINNGEFNEDVYADAGTINITGGTFTNFAPSTDTGTISISGGIFDAPVPEEYCADGYIPAVYDAESGLYTVKEGYYVARIDTAETYTKLTANITEPNANVYLDMWTYWGMQGMLDANGNKCPRYVSITDDTMYRDLAVEEGEDEDWVSAKYLYDNYFAPGKSKNNKQKTYLYNHAGSEGTKYETLVAAAAAAQKNDTITLLTNTVESAVLPYAVTLDKDGFSCGALTAPEHYVVINFSGNTDLYRTFMDNWERPDYADLSWYTANPNADSFEIATAAQFAGFAQLVNGKAFNADGTPCDAPIYGSYAFRNRTITLTDDIDLTAHGWVPVGLDPLTEMNADYTATLYRGTFDGGDHTITFGLAEQNSIYDFDSLFGGLYYTTIKNLKLNMTISYPGDVSEGYWNNDVYGGACALASYAANSVVISNVTMNGTATFGTYGSTGGGLVAVASAGAQFYDCVNNTTVNIKQYYRGGTDGYFLWGGIVCQTTGTSSSPVPCALFVRCVNNATVTMENPYDNDRLIGRSATGYGSMNRLAELGKTQFYSRKLNAGGIVGQVSNTGYLVQAVDCKDNGTIIGGHIDKFDADGHYVSLHAKGSFYGKEYVGGSSTPTDYTINVSDKANQVFYMNDNTYIFDGVEEVDLSACTLKGEGSYYRPSSSSGKIVQKVNGEAVEVTDEATIEYLNKCARLVGPVVSNSRVVFQRTPVWVAQVLRTENGDVTTNKFESLAGAVAAAQQAGDTVQLLTNVVETAMVTVQNGQDITLDLAGWAITADETTWTSGDMLLCVNYGAKLTVDDSSEEGTGLIDATTNGKPTGALYGAVKLTSPGDTSSNGTAQFVLNGGTLKGTNYGISGNGNRSGTAVTINGGKVIATGNATDREGNAIYQPQNGTLTINGGELEGWTAVYAKAGTVSVTDGALKGTGSAVAYGFYGNGGYSTGDALVIDNCGYPGGAPSATVSGGTFTSTNGKGIGSYAGNGQTDLASVTANTNEITIPENETWIPEGNGYRLVKAFTVTWIVDGTTVETDENVHYGDAPSYDADAPTKTADADGVYSFDGWTGGSVTDPTAVANLPTATGDVTYTAHFASVTSVAMVFTVTNDGATTNDVIYYATLAEAVGAAQSGQTVALLADETLTSMLTVQNGQDITLDLNGKTLSADETTWTSGDMLLCVNYGAKLTVDDSSEEGTGLIDATTNGKPTGALYGAVKLTSPGDTSSNGTAQFVLNGGTLKGTNYGISGNGNRSGTAVTINGGKVIATGNATDREGNAIYQPQNGTLTINGGELEGWTAVYAKAGTVSVTDGALKGTGSAVAYGFYGNGGYSTGDALVIDNCGYPGGAPSATVSGGTFTSTNGKGIGSYAGNGQTDLASVTANTNEITIPENETWIPEGNGYRLVKAFTVTWIVDGTTVETDENVHYGDAPSYNGAAPTKTADADGVYTFDGWTGDNVADPTAVADLPAATGDVTYTAHFATATSVARVIDATDATVIRYYATLADAIDEAQNGDTVEVLAGCSLPDGVMIAKNLVITGAVDNEGKPLFTVIGPASKTSLDSADIYVFDVAGAPVNVTISNLKFTGFGNAVEMDDTSSVITFDAEDSDSTLTLTNLEFSDYNTFAVATLDKGLLTMRDCVIDGTATDNRATGGIYAGNGEVIVSGGEIKNVDTGIVAASDASIVLTDATITASDVAVDVYEGSNVTIDGGSYAGALVVSDEDDIVVSSGLFDRYVNQEYCAPGKVAVPADPADAPAGWYQVIAGSLVAKVTHNGEDTLYASLADAIAAAQDGDTVTLVDNVTAERTTISKGITLDLGGKTLTGRVTIDNGEVTVQNGTIAGRFDVYDSATVTLAADATVNGQAVVWGDGTSGESGCKTPTFNVYGTVSNTGDAAITCNGTDKSGAVINVYDGAKVTSDDIAIYLPSGNLTVSGGEITGATAVYAKSGSVSVTGGTLTGNGTAAAYVYDGNGANATGDALVIENCGYPNDEPSVSITGGTFISENAKSVATYATEGKDPVEDFIPATVNGQPNPARFSDAKSDGVPEGYTLVEDGDTGLYMVDEAVTVTFVNKKVEATEKQIIGKGRKATEPEDPTAVGDTFLGWFAAFDDTEPFDFDTAIDDDLTLTARWQSDYEAATFDLTFTSFTQIGETTWQATFTFANYAGPEKEWKALVKSTLTGQASLVKDSEVVFDDENDTGTVTVNLGTADAAFLVGLGYEVPPTSGTGD